MNAARKVFCLMILTRVRFLVCVVHMLRFRAVKIASTAWPVLQPIR